jgi:hypothetical protein
MSVNCTQASVALGDNNSNAMALVCIGCVRARSDVRVCADARDGVPQSWHGSACRAVASRWRRVCERTAAARVDVDCVCTYYTVDRDAHRSSTTSTVRACSYWRPVSRKTRPPRLRSRRRTACAPALQCVDAACARVLMVTGGCVLVCVVQTPKPSAYTGGEAREEQTGEIAILNAMRRVRGTCARVRWLDVDRHRAFSRCRAAARARCAARADRSRRRVRDAVASVYM